MLQYQVSSTAAGVHTSSRVIPYFAVNVGGIPYTLRLINTVVDVSSGNPENPSKDFLHLGRVIAGEDALKHKFALELTLFPYRLIGAEVNWLLSMVTIDDRESFCETIGTTPELLDIWMWYSTAPVSQSVEKLFRLSIYSLLTIKNNSLEDIDSAYITKILSCKLQPRPITTLPIVIITPAYNAWQMAGRENSRVPTDPHYWMVNITIDPDMDVPVEKDMADEKPAAEPPPENTSPKPKQRRVLKPTVLTVGRTRGPVKTIKKPGRKK